VATSAESNFLKTPQAEAPQLLDGFGRVINYARVSLTDRCNFRCLYCMPQGGRPFIPHERILHHEEMLRLCARMAELGISSYKITGGEPLCRKDAAIFIKQLIALPGVREVSLTTNGSLIAPQLEDLAAHGLKSVTFSLDAMTPEALRRVTRSDTPPGEILASMDLAAALGLRVKINTVLLKGLNDAELVPLTRYALERGWHIRFIELMPVGEGKQFAGIAPEEVFRNIEAQFGQLSPVSRKTGNGPAVMYSLESYPGLVGFIAALSGRFCASCNRVRLVSTGFLKTCLCHEAGIDLRGPLREGASDAKLTQIIRDAVSQKPQGHVFSFDKAKADVAGFNMNSVGG
jgi:cyclic pyranopterin phosphate synthase